MKLIPYNPNNSAHLNMLREMLIARDMSELHSAGVPEHSWIVVENDQPIAFGGLRKVEGGMAIMDSYLTNPNAPSDLRHKALEWLTYKLIKISRHYLVTKLLAFSQSDEIFNRAKSHGFIEFSNKIGIITL